MKLVRKKISYIAFVIIVFLISACSSDDDQVTSIKTETILGQWEMTRAIEVSSGKAIPGFDTKQKLLFNKDNTYKVELQYTEEQEGKIIDKSISLPGTWNLEKGNKLALKLDDFGAMGEFISNSATELVNSYYAGTAIVSFSKGELLLIKTIKNEGETMQVGLAYKRLK